MDLRFFLGKATFATFPTVRVEEKLHSLFTIAGYGDKVASGKAPFTTVLLFSAICNFSSANKSGGKPTFDTPL